MFSGKSPGKGNEAPIPSKEQAQMAGNFALDFAKEHGPEYLDKMKELAAKATDGSLPQRILAVAGGAGMMVIGVMGFLGDTVTLNVIAALLSAYVIMFGLIIVVLEARNQICSDERKQKIYLWFKALEFVWGRGIFYVFCGSVLFSIGGVLDFIGGLYMTALGVLNLYMGYKSSKAMGSMKTEMKDDKAAAAKFHQFDKDKSGDLDSREFGALAKELGLELSHPMLETTIKMLDTDRSGTIGLEEFLAWYNSADMFTLPEAPEVV